MNHIQYLGSKNTIDGEDWKDIDSDFRTKIVPNISHWQHPNFFGFYPCNASYSSIIGELLSAGLGVQGMMWATSPACTELEMVVMDWLGKMVGLPQEFLFESNVGGGCIQGTASEAVLVSLVAARSKVVDKLKISNKEANVRLVGYTSDQAHSSIQKAFMIAGIDTSNLRLLKTDSETLALQPHIFRETVQKDIENGLIPFFLACTSGTTSTCAFDPISELGDICNEHDIWLHVDAAYAGSAAICPEYRHLINGVEKADSFNFNPHKWLLVNFDCSAFWVKDRKAITNSLSITPEYLKNKSSESGEVIDYRDWQVPLGRRFRSLKLWIVLRKYGIKKLQEHIRNHVQLAEQLEKSINEDGRLTVAYQRHLSLVTVVAKAGNDSTKELYEKINSSHKFLVSHTVIDGTWVIRISIGSVSTRSEHVEALWKHVKECLDEMKITKG